MASAFVGVLSTVYAFVCVFMIMIVLLQKGEGGGLAGAFGGMGGDSAFGVKGDKTFKKLTAVVGALFLFLAILLGGLVERGYQGATATEDESAVTNDDQDGGNSPSDPDDTGDKPK